MNAPLPPLNLTERLRAHWPAKLWIGASLGLLFCLCYFAAQLVPLREPYELRPSFIDRAIAFDPRWAWVYQSLSLMLPATWLASTRRDLHRYARGFLLITLVGTTVFFLFPTTVPRPEVMNPNLPYRWLNAYDRPVNCLPSQHLSLATYTTLFARAVLAGRYKAVVNVLAVWTLLIGYATLATKQHYFIDLPAGVLLGWIGHAYAWRSRRTAEGRID